jgi:hypothetical protein
MQRERAPAWRDDGSASGRWRADVAVGVALVLALVAASWSWVREIGCAIPDAARAGNPPWGADARLIIYVLAWASRALTTDPRTLFDPPVGYLAPRVLTGSEHFLGWRLGFAPLATVGGNVVLAVNLLTLASSWASGMAMFRLLRDMGLGTVGALSGALVNLAGPLQVPADVHQLQVASWGCRWCCCARSGCRRWAAVARPRSSAARSR